MKSLHVDIETFSDVDLKKCGVAKYAESTLFQVLLFGYCVDDGPEQVVDLASGEEIPGEILMALFDNNVRKKAFNAQFEMTCLRKHFGADMPPEQWECTSVHALYLGLPNDLDSVCGVIGAPNEFRKQKTGHALIRTFCVPCKPTIKNGGRTRNLPHHEPEKWELFKSYCAADVRAERYVGSRLIKFPVPEKERRLWIVDQYMFLRGVGVDMDLVDAAMYCDETVKDKLTHEAVSLTGLSNPNSVQQLIGWLQEEMDEEVTDLRKKTVPKLLESASSSTVERVLRLRQELSKSSVKKYEAMARSAGADGRLRGVTQFYGANRTGRWAGRIVQLQNLPQNKLLDLALARELVKACDIDAIEMLFGSVPDVLSQLIRTALVPAPGRRLYVSDFSAIEARVIAWLAGCKWRLDVFNTHGKIYEASAEQMFKLPPGSVTKKSPYRQKGKVAELACIAEGQPVLTDVGLVPIEEITPAMRVWDGVSFVPHDGVIFRGVKEVIEYDGLRATPDHVVWTNEGQQKFGDAAARGSRLVRSEYCGRPIRVGGDNQPGEKIHSRLVHGLRSRALRWLFGGEMVLPFKPGARGEQGVPVVFSAAESTPLADKTSVGYAAALHQFKKQRVQELRSAGDYFRLRVSSFLRALGQGKFGASPAFGIGPNRQQRPVRTWQSQVFNPVRTEQKPEEIQANGGKRGVGKDLQPVCILDGREDAAKRVYVRRDYRAGVQSGAGQAEKLEGNSAATRRARVYDLINCGPNHRFTVAGVLVHNCGYQGGVNALKAMGALDMGLQEDELQPIINAWRAANPEIVRLWYAIEAAMKEAIARGTDIELKIADGRSKLVFGYEKKFLTITLPSGRKLFYAKARLEPEDLYTENAAGQRFMIAAQGSVTYEGVDQKTKRWCRMSTYGGRAVENITQAIARDCLAESMLALDFAGFSMLFTVHDEIVAEETEDRLTEMEQIMGRPISWAPGLPLRADGFITDWYQKETE